MPEEIGVASSVGVKLIGDPNAEKAINKWLAENPDLEVIDIKFSSSATNDDWGTDALIIYRKDV